MSALIFIVILSVLVIIHELGHYFVAKWNKVQVNEFGLGYPPRALKLFTWANTLFSLNWVPFGGFVKLEGEDGAEENAKEKRQPGMFAFYERPALAKLAIILAGPLVNFLFGIVAFSVVFSVSGIPHSLDGQPRIERIMPDTPAAKANIPTSVNILGFKAADGSVVTTKSIPEVQQYVAAHKGQTVTIQFSGPCQQDTCAESLGETELYLRKDEEIPAGQGSMGIVFSDYYVVRYPWYLMPLYGSQYGITQALDMGWMMLQALGQMARDMVGGKGVSGDVAGPIGIVHQAQKSDILTSGWMMVLSFSGMISINLAVMNVLPIPALDGGRAFFIILGQFVGQKRIEKLENYANYSGFILLIGLIVLISLRDIARIIQGG